MKKLFLFMGWIVGAISFISAQNNAVVTWSDSIGCSPLTINFGVTATSGTPTSYLWNFGDGNTSTLQNPTHTYATNGQYFPFVQVSFAGGTPQNRWIYPGEVRIGPPRVFRVGIAGNRACSPGIYTFESLVDTSAALHEWNLTFPDGTSSTSNTQQSNFNLSQEGTYTMEYRTYFDPACPYIETFSFTLLNTLNLNPVIMDASCGGSDGSITLNPTLSNGTALQGPIVWSTGDSGKVVNNLPAGDYLAEVSYGYLFGCSFYDTLTVELDSSIDYRISTTNIVCDQDSTGEVDITINASNGPVNFLWNDGATTEDRTGLPRGIYTVTISDNSCSFTETIEIDSDVLNVNFASTDADCSGNGGSLEVFATGSNPPFAYSWSNGVTTSLNSNIPQGGYSVVVTDATGCADREVAFVEVEDSCTYMLSGRVFYDENGNCILDGNDFYLSGGTVLLDGGSQTTSLDNNGNYGFSVPSGTYDITISAASFPSFSSACPSSGSYTQTINLSDVSGLDFALQPDSMIIDLAVTVNNTIIRPGFSHRYTIHASNLGTVPMNGIVEFTHDPLVTYLSSNPTAVNYDPNTRTAIWNVSNLLPGQIAYFQVFGEIDSTVPLNTLINYSAEIGPITNDVNPANNIKARTRFVRGSYDPNDKQVDPIGEGSEGYIKPEENIMEYTIRFQNTGNFPAEFVVLRDTLDANLRYQTVKPVAASHPYKLNMKDNIMEVRFDNINLPDSTSDPEGSQGHFIFAVRHEGVLTPETEIKNTAAIFFDFNAPIITNTVVNTIADPTSIADPAPDGILIYPNPSKGIFNISSIDSNIEAISVYDLTGRQILQTDKQIIDLSGKEQGVYLVRVKTNKGQFVKRVSLNK
ncbi:MAG: T9SS type A sorting domain-containing protein [Bacteroidia bacterium]|nr:T9SS type A sorting domain-containing protein [Bacteroidia bacterium]